jgi:GAF domain-containing protein
MISKHALKVPDTEQERRQLFNELLADHGPQWAQQYEPGSFGSHELLDRTALAADLVERYVRTHPACIQNQEWFALAEQAVAALQELYQRIGAAHLDDK